MLIDTGGVQPLHCSGMEGLTAGSHGRLVASTDAHREKEGGRGVAAAEPLLVNEFTAEEAPCGDTDADGRFTVNTIADELLTVDGVLALQSTSDVVMSTTSRSMLLARSE